MAKLIRGRRKHKATKNPRNKLTTISKDISLRDPKGDIYRHQEKGG